MARAACIAELEQALAAAEQRAAAISARSAAAREAFVRARTRLAGTERQRLATQADLAQLRARHQRVLGSTMWRLSAPIRWAGSLVPASLRGGVRPLVHRVRRLLAPAVRPVRPDITVQPGQPRPSDLFRARQPGWVVPADRPPFARLRDVRARGRIAVVVHVYYPDLWPELSAAIANLDEPFDLFVTLVAGAAETMAPDIGARFPFAHVIVVDNHGRDIVPFLEILRTGVLFRYELVCKLHTKRSDWHEDGDAWRRSLIAGVLGGGAVARAIPAAFRADPRLGLVVADGHVYSGREMWVGNERHLLPLMRPFGMDQSAFDRSFAGGSIFWIRASLLRKLNDLALDFDDFECEPLGADGSMAHAVERLISLICYHAGATVTQTGAVMRTGAMAERV